MLSYLISFSDRITIGCLRLTPHLCEASVQIQKFSFLVYYICEWKFLLLTSFSHLALPTLFPPWDELTSAVERIAVRSQTWQVLDLLGQTGPTNTTHLKTPRWAPTSLELSMGKKPPDFKLFPQQDNRLSVGMGQSVSPKISIKIKVT